MDNLRILLLDWRYNPLLKFMQSMVLNPLLKWELSLKILLVQTYYLNYQSVLFQPEFLLRFVLLLFAVIGDGNRERLTKKN